MKWRNFHSESREPGPVGKGLHNERECPESELPCQLVQPPKIQNGAAATPFFRHKEIRAVDPTATVAVRDVFYGALPEEGVHFLMEEIMVGGIPTARMGQAMRGEGEELYQVSR